MPACRKNVLGARSGVRVNSLLCWCVDRSSGRLTVDLACSLIFWCVHLLGAGSDAHHGMGLAEEVHGPSNSDRTQSLTKGIPYWLPPLALPLHLPKSCNGVGESQLPLARQEMVAMVHYGWPFHAASSDC